MHCMCTDRGTVTSIKKLAVYRPRSANLCRTRKHICYASLKPMIMTSHTPKIILFNLEQQAAGKRAEPYFSVN